MASETVLIVEDEPDILDLVRYNMEQVGFTVIAVDTGEAAMDIAEEKAPSLIILDLMLPGIDGLEVCRLLKQRGTTMHIPILMLTARTEEVDRIVGLELGADDYLTKPFSPRELVLRARAILRRVQGGESETKEMVQVGPLAIDPAGHRVRVGSEVIELTAIEFRLLLTLAQRRGRVQSRDELLNVVWGYEHSGYKRTVDTHVRRLREKLGSAAEWIETVRGVGYRMRREGR